MESNLHWKYFLTVDQDISHLSRYIEFSDDNYGVYSIELARLFLSVCSEVDVVMKILCQRHCEALYCQKIKGKRNPNMDIYRSVLVPCFDYFSSISVEIPKCSISRIPWKEFTKGDNPSWWRAYNDVKHSRHNNYKKANLGNVIDATAGLLVAVIYLIAGSKNVNIDDVTLPSFFKLPDRFQYGGTRWAGSMLMIPERS